MPETHTHRGYEVRLRPVTGGWLATCSLPRAGTDCHFRETKTEALRAACETIDEFCLDAIGTMPDRTWNYRILRHETGGEDYFAIHSVYYEDGEPTSCSKERVILGYYEDTGHIEADLEKLQEALDKPVLNYSDF